MHSIEIETKAAEHENDGVGQRIENDDHSIKMRCTDVIRQAPAGVHGSGGQRRRRRRRQRRGGGRGRGGGGGDALLRRWRRRRRRPGVGDRALRHILLVVRRLQRRVAGDAAAEQYQTHLPTGKSSERSRRAKSINIQMGEYENS